jgi:hypothetical protein
MDRIWQKLAEHVGQETVDRIRGAIDRLVGIWTFVRDVQERGIVAIWEYIESQISGLWTMVLQQATTWIMEKVIVKATTWLLSLLDPTGIMPVINSTIAFFKAIQSAIEYLRDILAIINDYVTTIAAIARGELAAGAAKLEEGLANAIPIAIGFLANQFGLGRIGDKIAEIVGGVRELIDKALDWLIGQAVAAVQSLLATLGFGGPAGAEPEAAAAEEAAGAGRHGPLQQTFDFMGESHTLRLAPDGEGSVAMEMASDTWSVFPNTLRLLQSRHVARLRADNLNTEANELETALQVMIDEATLVGQPGGVVEQARESYQAEYMPLSPAGRQAYRAQHGTANDVMMDAWNEYYYRYLARLRELDATYDFSGGIRKLVTLGQIFADRERNVLMRVTEVNLRDTSEYGIRAQPANVSATSGGEFYMYRNYSASGSAGWGPIGSVPPLLPYPAGGISTTSPAWRTATRTVRINDAARSAGTPSNSKEVVPGISATHPFRGHLIANTLGGPGHFASGNIVAMTSNANLSEMKTKLEDPVRNPLIADPMKNNPANNLIFEVRVTPATWDPTNSYPTTINVEYEQLHPIPQPAVPDVVNN